MPVFKVTQPYLNLLVKPRIFSSFSGKKNALKKVFAFQNA